MSNLSGLSFTQVTRKAADLWPGLVEKRLTTPIGARLVPDRDRLHLTRGDRLVSAAKGTSSLTKIVGCGTQLERVS
jgi:hypothetical protein